MERNKMIEKIKKLLALANGRANIAEAQAAMLKAQELMVKNNIEISLGQKEKREVISVPVSTPGNYNFRFSLAQVVAKNFGCKSSINTRTKIINVYGCAGDVEIAVEIFNYAYQFCKLNGINERQKAKRNGEDYCGILNTYGEGFVSGLQAAYNEQCKSLVVVIPQEVIDYQNKNIKKSKRCYTKYYSASDKVYDTGYCDGKIFGTKDNKRLTA